jgi:hypothetical protein
LIEVTEKVIKDNDRKNKIVEELDTIKKNYEQSCREFENLGIYYHKRKWRRKKISSTRTNSCKLN